MLKKLMGFCLLPLLVALPTSPIVGAVEKLDGDSFRAACRAHRSGPQGTGETRFVRRLCLDICLRPRDSTC